DQGQDGTALPCRLEVVVTVGSFADEGGEQVPRRDAARIDAGVAGDPFVTGRATHQSAAGDLGDLPGCGLEHGQRPPSAWSASVSPPCVVKASRSRRRSSNGWTIPPISCPVSAPLPASRMVSPTSARRAAATIASPRPETSLTSAF